MPKEEAWKTLLTQQKAITEELEREISKLRSEDIVVENDALRNELTKCKAQLTEADQQVSRLSDENKKLNLLFISISPKDLRITAHTRDVVRSRNKV